MKINQKNNLLESIFIESWKPYAWIFFLGFLLFFQSLFFGIVYSDDNVAILERGPYLENLLNIFRAFVDDDFQTKDGAVYYRPFVAVSYILDTVFTGQMFFRHHLTNIIIHILAVFCLFRFFIVLCYSKTHAFFFSLLFLFHPIQTSAVVWFVGRYDPMLTIFVLLTFIAFFHYLKEGSAGRYLIHQLFFFSALLSKETAVVFPLIGVFYTFLVRKEGPNYSRLGKTVLGWAIVILIWYLMRNYAIRPETAAVETSKIISAKNFVTLWNNLGAIIPYLGKVLIPLGYSTYPILADMTFIYGIVTLVCFSVLIFLLRKRTDWKIFLFGFLWFVLFLVPTFINPDPSRAKVFLESRLYLPMIGIFLILLEFLKKTKLKKGLLVIPIVILTLFFTRTFLLSRAYKNGISYWEYAVKTSPQASFAHNNLGAMYYFNKDFDKAEKHWRCAAQINPSEKLVHNNLGLLYYNRGEIQKSYTEYLKEIRLNPLYDNVYYNLGKLFHHIGRNSEAIVAWQYTVKLNENHKDALYHLMITHIKRKENKKAQIYLERLQKRGVKVDDKIIKAILSPSNE